MCMSIHTIIVVRHGKVSGNKPDAPLTELGKQQARRVASFLLQQLINERALIVASPYARAVQTAEEISSTLELPLLFDDKLIERELGDITNLTDEELWCQLQSHFETPQLAFPHGESNAEVTQRVSQFLVEFENKAEGKGLIVVTHRITATILLQEFDKDIGFKECREMTNPDVYLVKIQQGVHQVKRIWPSPTSLMEHVCQ